ncbi:hypothetical protein SAMN05216188_13316 [Lentzea xinjiangensis]|uniref:Uncharacterized protein n=1 Tax=Lentzea xinjiangensis TaxID=402600 RepID=A0A1H9WF93_9PSEU|nr:hypothetical protein SAMN05216188_13316 [Lentzea xinjiangensis]
MAPPLFWGCGSARVASCTGTSRSERVRARVVPLTGTAPLLEPFQLSEHLWHLSSRLLHTPAGNHKSTRNEAATKRSAAGDRAGPAPGSCPPRLDRCAVDRAGNAEMRPNCGPAVALRTSRVTPDAPFLGSPEESAEWNRTDEMIEDLASRPVVTPRHAARDSRLWTVGSPQVLAAVGWTTFVSAVSRSGADRRHRSDRGNARLCDGFTAAYLRRKLLRGQVEVAFRDGTDAGNWWRISGPPGGCGRRSVGAPAGRGPQVGRDVRAGRLSVGSLPAVRTPVNSAATSDGPPTWLMTSFKSTSAELGAMTR